MLVGNNLISGQHRDRSKAVMSAVRAQTCHNIQHWHVFCHWAFTLK